MEKFTDVVDKLNQLKNMWIAKNEEIRELNDNWKKDFNVEHVSIAPLNVFPLIECIQSYEENALYLTLKTKIASLEDEVVHWKRKYSTMAEARKDLESLRSNNLRLVSLNDRLLIEGNGCDEQIDDLEQQVTNLTDRCRKSEDELEGHKYELRELQKHMKELDKCSSCCSEALNAEIERLRKMVGELEITLTKRNRQLEDLEGSIVQVAKKFLANK